MHTATETVSLAIEAFDRMFPFGVLVDGRGMVHSVGPSLQKIAGQDSLVGRSVFEVFTFKKPRRLNDSRMFQDVLDTRITFEVQAPGTGKPVSLFGMAFNITVGDLPHVALVMTPGVNARRLIEESGLRTSDFGPGDGSPDLLPLLAMQEEMVADSKKKSARLEAAFAEAERLAHNDPLTELPNRRALMKSLEEAVSASSLSVIHIDLDRFKEINDTFGHAAGDSALLHTASALRSLFGESGLCARMGGDEFVVVLRGAIPEEELSAWADAIIAAISEPFEFAEEMLKTTASVGLAQSVPDDGLSADELLHRADLALYEAKGSGRGHARPCTPELLKSHSAFQELSADMRRGIANREVVAFLQPQVHAETCSLVGFEALVRWNHPQRGLLSPASFLAAAQRAGIGQELDRAVRTSALNALSMLDTRKLRVPKVSLNVRAEDLLDPRFSEALMWDLEARNLEPRRLMLEIVESVLYDGDAHGIREACNRLVANGFTLALDDFGTGHASVLSLVNLPVTLVKIDRAFAAGVAADGQKRALVSSMIDIATNLGIEVLAEGVESEADVEVFQELGCDLFQAFHFGRPMIYDAAQTWIEKRGINPPALENEHRRA